MNHEKSTLSKDISCKSLWGVRRWSFNTKQSRRMSSLEGRRMAGLRLLQQERVIWGVVSKGISWEMRWLAKRCDEKFGGLLIHGAQGWSEWTPGLFFRDLNWKDGGRNSSQAWGILLPPGLAIGYIIPYWLMVVPMFLVSTPRVLPSFSYIKREKGSW